MTTQISNNQKAKAVIEIFKAIGEILQGNKDGTPSGTIYAALMQYGCSLDQYNQIIDIFKKSGRVKEINYLLYWI